jgi:CMP-N-acetylneuraminic acid synthetase
LEQVVRVQAMHTNADITVQIQFSQPLLQQVAVVEAQEELECKQVLTAALVVAVTFLTMLVVLVQQTKVLQEQQVTALIQQAVAVALVQ